MHVGGKLGFYYKDHEILPPLPGIDVFYHCSVFHSFILKKLRNYQPGLSVMEQCFSLTTNQLQLAYQPQKPSAEQLLLSLQRFSLFYSKKL